MGNQPFIGIDVWQIVFTLCNTLILYWIVSKLLFKPVKKLMDDRKQEIAELYEKAGEESGKAQALQREYSEKLAAARAEAARLLEGAQKQAEKRADAIVSDAQGQAGRLLEAAQRTIALEKAQAKTEVQTELTVLAATLAGKLLEADVTGEQQDKLLAGLLQLPEEP